MSNITTLEDVGLGDAPVVCSPLERCGSNTVTEVSVFTLNCEENSLSAYPIVLGLNNFAVEVA